MTAAKKTDTIVQSNSTPATNAPTQWYILRGDMKYGPYEYGVMLTMLQKGEVQDYNYVWAPHLENWHLLGELPDFSRDRLARLLNSNDKNELKNSFLQRQHARQDITIPVYGHNEHQFFDGESLSLSENGALILLNTPLLLPGQDILVHFHQSEINKLPFNAIVQIVRKNFTRQRINVKSGLHYAVRFLEIPDTGKKQIKEIMNSQGGKK